MAQRQRRRKKANAKAPKPKCEPDADRHELQKTPHCSAAPSTICRDSAQVVSVKRGAGSKHCPRQNKKMPRRPRQGPNQARNDDDWGIVPGNSPMDSRAALDRVSMNHSWDKPAPNPLAGQIQPYGIKESWIRTAREGFHPSVTLKSPKQVADDFQSLKLKNKERPTREEFIAGQTFQGKTYSQGRQITLSPFMIRDDWEKPGLKGGTLPAEPQQNGLLELLRITEIGAVIMEHVSIDGIMSMQKLALTCTEAWQEVFELTRIWDFDRSTMHSKGCNGVLSALTLESTVGEVMDAKHATPGQVNHWAHRAIDAERSACIVVGKLIRDFGNVEPFWGNQNRPDDTSNILPRVLKTRIPAPWVQATRAITNLVKLGCASQFVEGPNNRVYVAPAQCAMHSLRQLMTQIFQQRHMLTVLHFQKTPYFDRRVLAIILRACPNVRMLGVYYCPLVRFSDVICILDLIYEVNLERRASDQPQIQAFDFFPHFHHGMPYRHEHARTFGLSWHPQNKDWLQRGFYLILMKAFFKAKSLGIELLFSRDHAFLDYLFRLPNLPHSVPTFLSALHRWLELDHEAPGALSEKKKILYDMLLPVRIGLEKHMERDWPEWYIHEMGHDLVFCSSCGYEVLEEFIPSPETRSPPTRRVCAACIFQSNMESECSNFQEEKRKAVDALCPDWYDQGFNTDAPILTKSRGLIKMKATLDVASLAQLNLVSDQGVHVPRWKQTPDSLYGLPTLEELVVGADRQGSWSEAGHVARFVDTYNLTVKGLRDEHAQGSRGVKPFRETREDGGSPDTIDELQRRAPKAYYGGRQLPLFPWTYTEAWNLHRHLDQEFKGNGPIYSNPPPGFW